MVYSLPVKQQIYKEIKANAKYYKKKWITLTDT